VVNAETRRFNAEQWGCFNWGIERMAQQQGGQQEHAVLSQTGVNIRNLSIAMENQDAKQHIMLSLRVDVYNQGRQAENDLVLRAQVADPSGAVLEVGQSRHQVRVCELPAGGDRQLFLSYEIKHPQLGTPQRPCLYQVRLIIEDHKGRVLDTLLQSFGVEQFRPERFRVRQVGRNIALEPSDDKADTFWIANQFDYISLDRFEPHWKLQENGITIAQGKLDPMPVPPGQCIKMSLPISGIHYKAKARYECVLCFRPIAKTLWAPAEQSVSSGRLRVQ